MGVLKILKLLNGEDIVCTMEDYGKNLRHRDYVVVKDPVLLNQIRIPKGQVILESYILTPWVALSTDEEHEIPITHIVLISNAKDSLKENYQTFLESRKKATPYSLDEYDENEIDELDIDETLDNFLDNFDNDGDDDDQETSTKYRHGRIIH